MFPRLPVWMGMILLGALGMTAGCQGPQTAGPTEQAVGPRDDHGGMLLKTGAIQLGPGVGRNRWGWQGDGQSGF
jgi:hypothetical protein